MKKILYIFVPFVIFFADCHVALGFVGGAGTELDPYQITTPAELASLSSYLGSGNSGKYFKLMNDIDLDVSPYNTGSGWTPIGTSSSYFYGHFDGDGKVISNLYISRSGTYQGLFGRSSGYISNVGVTNINITITSQTGFAYIGGLVGYNSGTINDSYTTGTMSTTGWYCGGLVGIIASGGYVNQSYSTVNISGTYPRVGGLVGENDGGIYRSYATGNVTGTGSSANQYGGLIGIQIGSNATTTDSYATGNVSSNVIVAGFVGGMSQGLVTKSYAVGDYTASSGGGGFIDYLESSPTVSLSFWDTTVAGATSDAGTGKTTSEMKTQSTFTNTGWDFGTVWAINSEINNGYPYLRWQSVTPPDTTEPTASTTSPTINSVVGGALVTLSADASDETSLAGVSFYVDGILQGSEDTSSPYSITWDSTATTTGQKTIVSVARDTSNNYGTSTSVLFIVDNEAPSVSITGPTPDEIVSGASVSLTADASDTHSMIPGVKFYIDGTLVDSEDTSSPFALTWDSTATSSAPHSIFAVARDNIGNVATSTSVSFSVLNTGTTPGSILASGTSDGAVFTWSTASNTSSRVWFGISDTTSSSTPEFDTSSRVTSHSVTLSGLPSCSTFRYVVTGRNNVLDSATSTPASFTTSGCTGSASITESELESIETVSGGVVATGPITITVPTAYSSTTTQAVFQAQKLSSSDFFATAGNPSGKSRSSIDIYNLKALTDATTTLSSFDEPITITLSYGESDILGIDEDSLWIYRYDSSEWYALDSCVVDTSANTVTCTTNNFSDFGLFGDEEPVSSSGSSTISGSTVISQYKNLLLQGKIQVANNLVAKWPGQVNTITTKQNGGAKTPDALPLMDFNLYLFSRDLTGGKSGEDVVTLQNFLINQKTGTSSTNLANVGTTGYFGKLTKSALAEFQNKVGINPAQGYFGPITRLWLTNKSIGE